MNWVGGARSRVRHQNERKIQKDFFERKRLVSGPAKRHRVSPIAVEYKRLVSQDLLSLKALQSTCDTNIQTDLQDIIKAPQKMIDFDDKHDKGSNFNLELSVSPIMNPSILELHDVSSGGISLYDSQPKASTNICHPWQTCQQSNFVSSNQTLDIENISHCPNTSLLTESILTVPCKKEPHNPAPLSYTLSFGHSEVPLKKDMEKKHHNPTSSFNYTLSSDHSEVPLKKDMEKKHHNPTSSFNYTLSAGHSEVPLKMDMGFKRSKIIPKMALDTEKPLSMNKPTYSWEDMDWYRQSEVESKRDSNLPLAKTARHDLNQKTQVPVNTETTTLLNFHISQGGSNSILSDKNSQLITTRNPKLISSFLEEDPMGLCDSFLVKENDGIDLSLQCSESFSPTNSINSSATEKPLGLFERMIQSFEKPSSFEKQLSNVVSVEECTDSSGSDYVAQHHEWMDFISSIKPKNENESNPLSLVSSPVVSNDSKVPKDQVSEAYTTEDILLSQDNVFSPQPIVQSYSNQKCNAESDSFKSNTTNRVPLDHTTCKKEALCSIDTQTDSVHYTSTESQTDTVMFSNLGTQTDSLLCAVESQSLPVCLTNFNEKDIITNEILQELVTSYHILISSNDYQTVESEIDRLLTVFNERKSVMIWCSLMSKLKQMEQENI